MITWTSLISGNGVSYNFNYEICCNGVVTSGQPNVNYYDAGCCGSVGYAYSAASCCDGVVVDGISLIKGDSCPTDSDWYVCFTLSYVMRKPA